MCFVRMHDKSEMNEQTMFPNDMTEVRGALLSCMV